MCPTHPTLTHPTWTACRALDYLFGFHLSPLLWRKVPGAQSAGRVQSVALRLVCEREAAIAAFQQHMYYTVEAALQLPGDLAAMVSCCFGSNAEVASCCLHWPFSLAPAALILCLVQARVVSVDGQPPPQPGFTERKVADDVAARVAAAQFNVLEASTREQQRQPPAPFTTSTLQQEANKRLGLGEALLQGSSALLLRAS
jgi:DNA topoisomerase-1